MKLSVAAGLTCGEPRQLTPFWRSGGSYHVTTQFFLSRDDKTPKIQSIFTRGFDVAERVQLMI